MRRALLCSIVVLTISPAPWIYASNTARPLTEKQVDRLVSTAVQDQLKADKESPPAFIYRDHVVKPGKNEYAIVVQTTAHGSVRRVTRLNGEPIPLKQQKAQVERFVHSSALQQKQRHNDAHDARQATQLLRMIPKAFLWTVKSETSTQVTLNYKPNPSFHPPNKEDRVFAAMAGEMILDRQQHRIVAFAGSLIHNVNFFFGLIGHMSKGGTFSVRRKQVQPGVWEIVSTRIHIHGHILLFKTISQDEDDHDTAFQKAPQDSTLQQAAKLAMRQPDWPSGGRSVSSVSPASIEAHSLRGADLRHSLAQNPLVRRRASR